MQIIVEGQSYKYDQSVFKVSEGILLESLTGMTFKQWQEGLAELRPLAVKGLVYLVKVRAGETPDWIVLDFDMASIDFADDAPVVPPVPLKAEVEPVTSGATATATSASSSTPSAA